MQNKEERDYDVEPFNVIYSLSLYHAVKYNQGLRPSEESISDLDREEFGKFKNMFKLFLSQLNKHDQTAFSTLSALMQMWGYTRKYCGMCGKPVIGKGGQIHSRLVCPTCYGSYEITEALYKKESTAFPKKDRRKQQEHQEQE